MTGVYLLLGGNRGDVKRTFAEVCRQLESGNCRIIRRSSVYISPAWGFTDPTPFLNQVVEIDTILEPLELLEKILFIESSLGRIRKETEKNESRYESRLIDIDILLFGERVVLLPDLEIPHPRMGERRFALLPLHELAPWNIHPVQKISIREMLNRCTDESPVNFTDEV